MIELMRERITIQKRGRKRQEWKPHLKMDGFLFLCCLCK